MKLCFIDTLGLAYDGSTLTKRGLGGSESAVILMSRELVKLGFDVTVFNDCLTDDAQPGTYDGVHYKPLINAEAEDGYDIVIASRSIAAFAPDEIRQQFKTFLDKIPNFDRILKTAKRKILWMHDTFVDGDNLLEEYLLEGRIDEIFTLSDFHTAYVTSADHGKRRIFEVLKPYIFQTRNGINRWIDWVDIRQKDPNLFVYNSSLTKGMVPLVESVWPRVKQQIPDAKLVVIGGFYRFREGVGPDAQEAQWRVLSEKYKDQITFTGVIPQKEIAEILAKSSYMIYPCDFPETFGISALEALAYNTPLITCRFGALEETAFDLACYKIPYSVVPNWSVPWLRQDRQTDIFCGAVINAYNTPYLHQQKMYACNQLRGIEGWDTVALQWKQHFFKKLGHFLPIEEYRRVTEINHQVRKVFGRRFYNDEELQEPRKDTQEKIIVISAAYNAQDYIAKNILSVASQDYDNYEHVIINDTSTDNTADVIKQAIDSLSEDRQDKITVINRLKNMGAVYNIVNTIMDDESPVYISTYDIIMLLDGDDWLVNDPNIFHKYNNLYQKGAEFTYGSCWSLVDNIPLIAQPYPPEVKANKSYRDYKFNWNMPYTHLRTFQADLLCEGYDENDFKDAEGNWLRAGGDTAIFYHCIEQANPQNVICVSDIVMNYNDASSINDYKVNGEEQTRTANAVLSRQTPQKESKNSNMFSVIVPTMWRCNDIFFKTLKDLEEHPLVKEVLVINNDLDRTPKHFPFYKARLLNQGDNIGVNPALNLGVKESKCECLCLINDDVWFDTKVFDKIIDQLHPGAGIFGIIDGNPELGQPAPTDFSIDFMPWMAGDCIHSFGQMMFIHKSDWCIIPEEMKISFGDEYQLHCQTINKRPITLIYNIKQAVLKSATVKDLTIPLNTGETYLNDQKIYQEWAAQHPMIIDNRPYIPMINRCNIHTGIIEPIESIQFQIYGGGGAGGNTHEIPTNRTFIPSPQLTKVMPGKTVIFTPGKPKKKILIGIPTARYIEVETFKSIYDLEIPEGYETDFQYFYGYSVDQVRNLIASWVINQYDYLFAVDHDIVFAPDTLKKLLSHDKPIVSGIYRQRKEEQILEVYDKNLRVMPYEDLHERGLVEVGGCGFGCVLVKKQAFVDVGYPQFVYHDALDHNMTFSEDLDFLVKARQKGHTVWVDTSILCSHIGQRHFNVELRKKEESIVIAPPTQYYSLASAEEQFLENLAQEVHVPQEHRDYLDKMRNTGIRPKIIYDIGANVLDWARSAQQTWPESEIIAFEAMDEVKKLYDKSSYRHYIGVLSDQDGKHVKFYQDVFKPWGSSYYKENKELSEFDYTEDKAIVKSSMTLDTICSQQGFPLPDMIKLDVQGAELDILKGAKQSLAKCTDIIIELQHDEYNLGAPQKEEMIQYLKSQGFFLVSPMHIKEHDGDYHFQRPTGMVPSKAIIIRTKDPRSQEYAKGAAESCTSLGMNYEYFEGVEGLTKEEIRQRYFLPIGDDMDDKSACATASHFLVWQRVLRKHECAIILEHDASLMKPITTLIPHGKIVALGYKYTAIRDYNILTEDNSDTTIYDINRHSGAHAYAITWKTAEMLLRELSQTRIDRAIDNYYFMRMNQPNDTESCVPLAIMIPSPAMCLVRESTIWDIPPSTLNYNLEEAQVKYLKGATVESKITG